MKIQYTGKAGVKVEGVGIFQPGDERTVRDAVGRELCRGEEFREASTSSATATSSATTTSSGAGAEETKMTKRTAKKQTEQEG